MNVTRIRPVDGIPGDLTLLIAQYLQHRQFRGAKHNTLLAYGDDLKRMREFVARADVTLVQLVSERLLNRWLDDGLQHHGWSLRTAARRLAAVHMFLSWCRGEGYVDHDATQHVKIRFRPRTVVAPELEPLKDVITGIGTTLAIDLRDRAILLLLLDTALRAGEIALLDAPGKGSSRYTADLRRQQLRVRPKGGSDDDVDVLGMEEQTVAALSAWLRVRGQMAGADENAMFVNQNGTRFTRQSLYVMVRQRGADAGLPKLHPHLFRHRRIGDIVEKLGLRAGSAHARHRQVSTTANVYGAHAAEVTRQAIRTLAPLGALT
jgi:site-specific recombinase XerD